MTFHVPNKYRIRKGWQASDDSYENNGGFLIPVPRRVNKHFMVIASDGAGWEHVSACFPIRCPHWDEMCYLKALFWDPEDAVIQIHPPESEYVNCHPNTLHLWRKADTNDFFEAPPAWMVGPPP